MNVVFLGSGAFGLPTLRALAHEHTIAAIVTQPDRRAGRGGKTTPTPIGAWAAEHLSTIPLLKPERVNEPSVREQVRAFNADAWVVIAFGQYLGSKLVEDRFAINLHASLLPRWRGAAPINAAVLAGDTRTGNSVITIAKEMDAGDVLGQSRRPIEPTQTAGELHDLLADDGPALVLNVLADRTAGTLVHETQAETKVTLAAKMNKADGWIDFNDSAATARCRVHGLNPWPGVTVQHRDQPLKLLRVMDHNAHADAAPGTITDPAAGLVACATGTLRLIEVQPAGKRPMPWADYANGRQVKPGEALIGRDAD
jgi:methionyl-tRNA formyltransferase